MRNTTTTVSNNNNNTNKEYSMSKTTITSAQAFIEWTTNTHVEIRETEKMIIGETSTVRKQVRKDVLLKVLDDKLISEGESTDEYRNLIKTERKASMSKKLTHRDDYVSFGSDYGPQAYCTCGMKLEFINSEADERDTTTYWHCPECGYITNEQINGIEVEENMHRQEPRFELNDIAEWEPIWDGRGIAKTMDVFNKEDRKPKMTKEIAAWCRTNKDALIEINDAWVDSDELPLAVNESGVYIDVTDESQEKLREYSTERTERDKKVIGAERRAMFWVCRNKKSAIDSIVSVKDIMDESEKDYWRHMLSSSLELTKQQKFFIMRAKAFLSLHKDDYSTSWHCAPEHNGFNHASKKGVHLNEVDTPKVDKSVSIVAKVYNTTPLLKEGFVLMYVKKADKVVKTIATRSLKDESLNNSIAKVISQYNIIDDNVVCKVADGHDSYKNDWDNFLKYSVKHGLATTSKNGGVKLK